MVAKAKRAAAATTASASEDDDAQRRLLLAPPPPPVGLVARLRWCEPDASAPADRPDAASACAPALCTACGYGKRSRLVCWQRSLPTRVA